MDKRTTLDAAIQILRNDAIQQLTVIDVLFSGNYTKIAKHAQLAADSLIRLAELAEEAKETSC